MAQANLLEQVLEQTEQEPRQPLVHIRFDGRSIEVNQGQLDIGINSTDNRVREAIANHLGVPPHKLEAFAIDRNQQTGDMTLRPEAVFGR